MITVNILTLATICTNSLIYVAPAIFVGMFFMLPFIYISKRIKPKYRKANAQIGFAFSLCVSIALLLFSAAQFPIIVFV